MKPQTIFINLLFIVIITHSLSAVASTTNIVDIYENGVVRIHLSYYIDDQDIRDIDKVRKIEEKLGFKLTNIFYTISSSSGWPLINDKGNVIGINVGIAETTNNIFFSIPINALKAWLKGLNQYSKIDLKASGTRNESSSETGNAFITSKPSNAKVYIDEIYKGTTPIAINKIKVGSHKLVLKYDTYFNKKNPFQ